MRATTSAAIISQTGIVGIGRTATQTVVIVGQLGNALAHLIESVDVENGAEVAGILLSYEDADLPGGLGSNEVGRSLHPDEILGPRGDQPVPTLDVGERCRVDVAGVVAHRCVKHSDPGRFNLLEVVGAEEFGVQLPGEKLWEIQGDQAQHIYNCGGLNQFDRQGRVFLKASCKKTISAAVDEGSPSHQTDVGKEIASR